MAALPTTTAAFASGATEAQFKTFITEQRSFLAGLLGTDGLPSTAKATLGVSDGVTSVNGATGAVSSAQIAAAATAGYGYAPVSAAQIGASHVPKDFGTGGLPVGVWVALTNGPASTIAPGAAVAGSSLQGSPSGTWRNIAMGTIAINGSGLMQRIA